MADEQETSNEDENMPEYRDESITDGSLTSAIVLDEETTTIPTTKVTDLLDDYGDDEDLPPVTVNLFINDAPGDVTLPSDLVNAGITDQYGNPILPSTTPILDSINDYTTAISQGIYDEVTGNGTSIDGKGWFGSWTWTKILFLGLIALCIIAIILALLFFILGKKFRTNKRTTTPGTTSTTKSVVTANPTAAGGKYEPVRNV